MHHGKYGEIVLRDESSLKDFYKGKKIFLTGHTGFKGTWMSVMLENLGAEICGYSLPLSKSSFYYKVSPNIKYHVEGDISDEKKVFQTIDAFQPEIIIHLASHSSLEGSTKIPDFILRTNFMGCMNVLEASRKLECIKAVVIVTSDKCYQNMETDEPYVEDSPLGAKDPYSTSKVCQELLTSCYEDTFLGKDGKNIGISTARASNVIGAGDYNISRLMPYLLDSYLNDNVPQIRNPYAIRPWQYVLDVLYGYLLLTKKLYESSGITSEYNGAYNFGPREDGFVQVGKVAQMVGRCFENATFIQKEAKDHIRQETQVLKLDSSKAQKVLNWKPQKSLEEAVSLTVDFVKKEKMGIETARLCREQVDSYLEGVR